MCEKLRATRQCSSIKDIFAPIHSQALSAFAITQFHRDWKMTVTGRRS
jgi:hypothetical protein